jgi:hypothetical protein
LGSLRVLAGEQQAVGEAGFDPACAGVLPQGLLGKAK